MGTAQPLSSKDGDLSLPNQREQIKDLLSLGWLTPAEQKQFKDLLDVFCSAEFIHQILVVPNLNPPKLQTWGIEIPPSLENCCGQKPALVFFSQITLTRNKTWGQIAKTGSLGLTLAGGACLINYLDYGTLIACPGTRLGKRIPVLIRVKERIEGIEQDIIKIMHFVGENDKSPDLVMPAVPKISLVAQLQLS